MTNIDPNEAVRDRALVVAKDGQGGIVGTGRVIAYSVVPTFTIERPDGTRLEWRHDMVEPAIHGKASPGETLSRNQRVLQHEMETPMRGHDADGRCCLLASLGAPGWSKRGLG
jgi:hypothetical protein